jgi:hypothetical protein
VFGVDENIVEFSPVKALLPWKFSLPVPSDVTCWNIF